MEAKEIPSMNSSIEFPLVPVPLMLVVLVEKEEVEVVKFASGEGAAAVIVLEKALIDLQLAEAVALIEVPAVMFKPVKLHVPSASEVVAPATALFRYKTIVDPPPSRSTPVTVLIGEDAQYVPVIDGAVVVPEDAVYGPMVADGQAPDAIASKEMLEQGFTAETDRVQVPPAAVVLPSNVVVPL